MSAFAGVMTDERKVETEVGAEARVAQTARGRPGCMKGTHRPSEGRRVGTVHRRWSCSGCTRREGARLRRTLGTRRNIFPPKRERVRRRRRRMLKKRDGMKTEQVGRRRRRNMKEAKQHEEQP